MVRLRTMMSTAPLCLAVCLSSAARGQSVLKQMQSEVAGIVRNTRSAVVSIEDMGTSQLGLVSADGKASNSAAETPKSGTGFSIGDGYVVTTADVCKGMMYPVVITDAGARIRAAVVGYDNDLNVGLVRLLAKTDVPVLQLGDSSSLAVGHFAITIGNQDGQENSVALMLVGGLRTGGTYSGDHFYPSLIQIAGTVGAGTSGAPLVNVDSEVVGIMAAVPADATVWVDVPQASRDLFGFTAANTLTAATLSVPRADALQWKAVPQRSQGLSTPTAGKPAPRSNRYHTQKKKGGKTSRTDGTVRQGRNAAPSWTTLYFEARPANTVTQTVEAKKVLVLGDLPIIGRLVQTPGRTFTAVAPALHSPVTSAGFAVPINDLKPVIEALRAGKPVEHGWLGVDLQTQEQTVEDDGVIKSLPTVVVRGIFPDSPAFHSSLQPGDIVMRIDEESVQTDINVRAIILKKRPGDEVRLAVRRQDMRPTVRLTIAKRPEEFKAQPITTPIKGPR